MKWIKIILFALYCMFTFRTQAQKYKGWYIGFNAGIGHAYYHNKNFDYFINAKGKLEQYSYHNGVLYDRQDPFINNLFLSFELDKDLSKNYSLTSIISNSTSKHVFHMGTNGSVGALSTWYPDGKIMSKFPAETNISYLQVSLLFGKSFSFKKDLKFEAKAGMIIGLLKNVDQYYQSKRDTFSTFEARGNNRNYYSIARSYTGQEVLHSVSYTSSYKLYNHLIPGFLLQLNFIGKFGAGKVHFEKWRYKFGIYAQTDLRNIDGNAWNYFTPPKMEYPNAPSYIIRSGIQFDLSYHFNKR